MSKPPLDYLRPGAINAASLRTIAQHLKRRQRGLSAGVATMLVLGLPMLLLGPLVLGTLFWFASFTSGSGSRRRATACGS